MTITLDFFQLQKLLENAADYAIKRNIEEYAPKKDQISKNEAYRKYGTEKVDRWVRDGKVSSKRMSAAKNSKIIFSRAELAKVDAAEYAHSYFAARGIKKT